VPDIYGSPPPSFAQPPSALSDPLRLIQGLGALQDFRIRQQQAPALAQQPAAALTGQNIQNATAQAQQEAAWTQLVQSRVASELAGKENPTPDDVRTAITNTSRGVPQIAVSRPDILTNAGDFILKDAKGNYRTSPADIKRAAADMLNLATPPDAGLVTVNDPKTNQPITMTRQQANMMALAPNSAATGGPAPSTSLPGFASGPPAGAEQSTAVMQADLARAGNFKTDIFPLTQALDLAKSLGPGGMAPGSKGRQDFESFVYGLMPSLVPAGMQDKIKNYAELEKYLVNNASQRANSMGPHTNDGLAQATTGSPNVHINDLAGIDLIKAQIALRRMEQAQTIQAAKGGPVSYTTNKAQTAAGFDPRAFQIDLMNPDQVTKLQKTLKGAERVKFNASLRAAIDSGAITQPGQ
jgi:hypothetical protein